jgi:SET domain-containing protein
MPMLVRTTLKEVPHKGIGLFTVGKINKGEIIYKDDTNFDRIFLKKEVDTFPPVLQEYIHSQAAYNKDTEEYYLCCDNARFWNHSDTPNTKYSRETGLVIALQDIAAGEELTSDYREFCDSCKEGDFGFEIYP